MKIIGLIPVYNEVDIVGQVIEHLIGQGISLVILDNGSIDGSFELMQRYVGKGVLSLERLVTDKFETLLMWQMLHEMMLPYEPEWALRCSADEFLESPYRRMPLSKAIQLESEKGHNVIQFDNFEFFPTEKDSEDQETDVRQRLRFYSWHDDNQYRCSKVYAHISPRGSVHKVDLPKGVRAKVSPNKFVLRHYRIRSYEHGLRKVFRERLPRVSSRMRAKGFNVHYDNFGSQRAFFVIDSRRLTRYEEDSNWNLTKTFDGTFGAWNPPTDREVRELLEASIPFRLARRIPIGSRLIHQLFTIGARRPDKDL